MEPKETKDQFGHSVIDLSDGTNDANGSFISTGQKIYIVIDNYSDDGIILGVFQTIEDASKYMQNLGVNDTQIHIEIRPVLQQSLRGLVKNMIEDMESFDNPYSVSACPPETYASYTQDWIKRLKGTIGEE